MSNLHTHTHYTHIKCFVWKGGGRYGLNMNHMIAMKSLESSFQTYILPSVRSYPFSIPYSLLKIIYIT